MMYVKVFELTHGRPNSIPKRVLDVSLTTFTLRVVSSIGELLLLLYKSGFYRRE